MSKATDDAIALTLGTIIGALTGVVAGMLYSPKSGEEIRKEIKDMACKIKTKMPSDIECAQKAGSEAITKLKYTIDDQLNKINDAVKAGRMAAAKRKEELESDYTY